MAGGAVVYMGSDWDAVVDMGRDWDVVVGDCDAVVVVEVEK